MTPAEALREASHAGRFNQFEISVHAHQRMQERNVTRRDICFALKTATVATAETAERWRFGGGHDEDGEPLGLVAVLAGRCLVVTVF